jgi:hypothetical protein
MSQLFAFYGLFLLQWAAFESTLEYIIYREAKLTQLHAIIIVSGLGFERKASIARSLLALKSPKFDTAIKIINKITQQAERNALVHGYPAIAKDTLLFTKRSTDQKLKAATRTFDRDGMRAKHIEISALMHELTTAAAIENGKLEHYEKTVASLASKA